MSIDEINDSYESLTLLLRGNIYDELTLKKFETNVLKFISQIKKNGIIEYEAYCLGFQVWNMCNDIRIFCQSSRVRREFLARLQQLASNLMMIAYKLIYREFTGDEKALVQNPVFYDCTFENFKTAMHASQDWYDLFLSSPLENLNYSCLRIGCQNIIICLGLFFDHLLPFLHKNLTINEENVLEFTMGNAHKVIDLCKTFSSDLEKVGILVDILGCAVEFYKQAKKYQDFEMELYHLLKFSCGKDQETFSNSLAIYYFAHFLILFSQELLKEKDSGLHIEHIKQNIKNILFDLCKELLLDNQNEESLQICIDMKELTLLLNFTQDENDALWRILTYNNGILKKFAEAKMAYEQLTTKSVPNEIFRMFFEIIREKNSNPDKFYREETYSYFIARFIKLIVDIPNLTSEDITNILSDLNYAGLPELKINFLIVWAEQILFSKMNVDKIQLSYFLNLLSSLFCNTCMEILCATDSDSELRAPQDIYFGKIISVSMQQKIIPSLKCLREIDTKEINFLLNGILCVGLTQYIKKNYLEADAAFHIFDDLGEYFKAKIVNTIWSTQNQNLYKVIMRVFSREGNVKQLEMCLQRLKKAHGNEIKEQNHHSELSSFIQVYEIHIECMKNGGNLSEKSREIITQLIQSQSNNIECFIDILEIFQNKNIQNQILEAYFEHFFSTETPNFDFSNISKEFLLNFFKLFQHILCENFSKCLQPNLDDIEHILFQINDSIKLQRYISFGKEFKKLIINLNIDVSPDLNSLLFAFADIYYNISCMLGLCSFPDEIVWEFSSAALSFTGISLQSINPNTEELINKVEKKIALYVSSYFMYIRSNMANTSILSIANNQNSLITKGSQLKHIIKSPINLKYTQEALQTLMYFEKVIENCADDVRCMAQILKFFLLLSDNDRCLVELESISLSLKSPNPELFLLLIELCRWHQNFTILQFCERSLLKHLSNYNITLTKEQMLDILSDLIQYSKHIEEVECYTTQILDIVKAGANDLKNSHDALKNIFLLLVNFLRKKNSKTLKSNSIGLLKSCQMILDSADYEFFCNEFLK